MKKSTEPHVGIAIGFTTFLCSASDGAGPERARGIVSTDILG